MLNLKFLTGGDKTPVLQAEIAHFLAGLRLDEAVQTILATKEGQIIAKQAHKDACFAARALVGAALEQRATELCWFERAAELKSQLK